jgi:hypothetical protein
LAVCYNYLKNKATPLSYMASAMDAIEKIARLNESKAIFKDEYKKKMKSNLDIYNYCFLLSHRD